MGGQSALARELGVRQGHVWAWMNRDGCRAPLEHCPAIEVATAARGARVPCEELRPDVDWVRDGGRVTGYTVRLSGKCPAPPHKQKAA